MVAKELFRVQDLNAKWTDERSMGGRPCPYSPDSGSITLKSQQPFLKSSLSKNESEQTKSRPCHFISFPNLSAFYSFVLYFVSGFGVHHTETCAFESDGRCYVWLLTETFARIAVVEKLSKPSSSNSHINARQKYHLLFSDFLALNIKGRTCPCPPNSGLHVFILLNLFQINIKLMISIESSKIVQLRRALTQQKLFP